MELVGRLLDGRYQIDRRLSQGGFGETSEQLRGRPIPSSDLYAFGMVVIQALTGVMPRNIPEDEDEEMVWQDLATVSPSVSALLTTMVKYSAKEQFRSAAAILTALAQMANEEIIKAYQKIQLVKCTAS